MAEDSLVPIDPNLSLREAAAKATPARVFVGRRGVSYSTAVQLKLREDHAAARDAVSAELDLAAQFDPEFVARWGLFQIETLARDKREFLLRPDRGRALSDTARRIVQDRCPLGADLQLVLGDGLSLAALLAQAPALLPRIVDTAQRLGWTTGQPFVVKHCRVGVLNDVGALLAPKVVALLIGERPGMATAESLSVYMAWRPVPGDTDAKRNLISNIHARGVAVDEAATRVVALARQMVERQASGVDVKESAPS